MEDEEQRDAGPSPACSPAIDGGDVEVVGRSLPRSRTSGVTAGVRASARRFFWPPGKTQLTLARVETETIDNLLRLRPNRSAGAQFSSCCRFHPRCVAYRDRPAFGFHPRETS